MTYQRKWALVLSCLQVVPTLQYFLLFKIAPRTLQEYSALLMFHSVTHLPASLPPRTPSPDQLGILKLHEVFREKQILMLPKSPGSPGAAGWPKLYLTEAHPSASPSSTTWLSLAHSPLSKIKAQAKGCSPCCGSSGNFPTERKISSNAQKEKE